MKYDAQHLDPETLRYLRFVDAASGSGSPGMFHRQSFSSPKPSSGWGIFLFLALVFLGMAALSARPSALNDYDLRNLSIGQAVFFGIGYLLQSALINPFVGRAEHEQFILLVGLGMVIVNGLLMIFGPDARPTNLSYALDSYEIGPLLIDKARLVAAAAALVVAAILFAFFRLTATGTNQATALQLAGLSSLQEVTTVASSTGVLLPVIKLPATVTIANQGANTLAIFPSLGGTIDNGTVNTSVTLASGKSATFTASSLTNWYTAATTASR